MNTPQSFRIELSIEEIRAHIQRSNANRALLLVDSNQSIVLCHSGLAAAIGKSVVGETLAQAFNLNEPITRLYEDYVKASISGEVSKLRLLIFGRVQESVYEIYRHYASDLEEWMYILSVKELLGSHERTLLQCFAGSLMKDVNLGVLLIDADFSLIDISDMACRVLGLVKSSIVNTPMERIFASVPHEHRLVQPSLLEGVIVRNHAVSWTNNQERFELLLDSNLLKDSAGHTVGAYVIFKDVTNLRSLEEQVQRSDRLAMIGQIAAGTAHEIRNPLTSIKGFLQVLKNTFVESGMEKEQSYTDIMLMEINRINELVSEFLLLGKRKNVSFDRVSVTAVMREMLPIINNEAILHGVSVQYEHAEDAPQVIADRELLKQVFLNICKNGIEAMQEGGTLSISEKVVLDERKVHVDVHDSGPGIPNFVIDKIFDPFFTTKEDGTGLGLSVCQRIIHDMGGSIRVSSKGFGTTFTVCIPIP
ncbi:ATP-binding protein [Paenibacillus sp. MBLB4367]|uniref:ATP-binding protein n=1 Tax=Paenibacillus sp. MBLB4367 TaxID=3384767 RepID=UPI0039081354